MTPKVKDRVTDGTRTGTVINVGEQVSQVKFDNGYVEYISNRWLKPITDKHTESTQ